MTKTLSYVEKVIAVLLIIYGAILILVNIRILQTWIEYQQKEYSRVWNMDFVFDAAEHANGHFLIGFLPLIAGIALILAKQTGWVLAMNVAVIGIIEYLFLLAFEIHYPPLGYTGNGRIILISSVLSFFFILSILLIKPAIRNKYLKDNTLRWITLAVFAMLLLDFYFTYLKGRVYNFL